MKWLSLLYAALSKNRSFCWDRNCGSHYNRSIALLFVAWLSVGCATSEMPTPVPPTVAAIFQSSGAEAAEPTFTPTPQPLLVVPETPTPSYDEVMIYDDGLAPNWGLEYSVNLTYDLEDTEHWFEPMGAARAVDSGAVSMLVTPDEGWGTLHFTLNPEVDEVYERDQVQGVSFWVNSNSDYMSNDAIVVAFVGSNEYTYWQPDDTSALTEFGYFPEIPLYDLQVNEAIPPNTWVQVVLSMDKLLFGPDYQYVTGVYLKTKSFQVRPFNIDRVSLLLSPQ